MSTSSTAKPALLLFSGPGVFGDCLDCYLRRLDQVQLAGWCHTVPEMLAAIPHCRPALVVVDAWDAPELAASLPQLIRAQWPGLRCLVLADSVPQAALAQSQGDDALLFWQLWPDKLAAKIEWMVAVEAAAPAVR